jgi:uncharacterized protein YjdB
VATVSGSTVTLVDDGETTITATQAASGDYLSNSITAQLVVTLPPATLSNFSVPSKVLGDAPFELTDPSSNSTGAFTYSSSDETVATVSGSTVTIVGAGETTITATQAASGNYLSNSITAQLVVVAPATLSNFSVPAKALGDAPFELTAPSSNSTGSFTYTSSNLNVATVSGSTVTIVGAGTATITATQAASGDYLSNSITAQLVVNRWRQLGQDIDGEAANDYSGSSVSLSSDGSRVAIGAMFNDSYAGHVRVYDLSGNGWIQVGQDIDGEAANDYSGLSVSLSSDGSRVAIGASGNDGTGDDAGHVRVYDLVGNTWTQVGQDIDGEAAGDNSGHSVSLSSDGSRVAIGAIYNAGTGVNAGHVRVYDLSGNSWIQVGQDIDGEAAADYNGWNVSLSSDGSRVAIGAIFNDGTGDDAGHVRVYDLSGNSWIQVGQDIDGEAAGDQSGYSVSLSSSGSRVAIGAAFNNGSNEVYLGHVRVYDLSGNTWIQVGQDIDGEASFDTSGRSISLSSDGSRVAIGAIFNDGTGVEAGHVRVYDLSGNSWIQVGLDIDGEAQDDLSGYSVRLSSNGTRVAIGAIYNDGTASNAGHVRVYELIVPATLSNFSVPAKALGDAPFALTAPSSNSTGAFTYTSSDDNVATVSGSTVTIVGIGETTITATQAASGNYLSNSITAQLVVSGWRQLGQDIDGEAANDFSGHSVSLSSNGTRVAIGAYNNDGTASNAGHVRVYDLIGTTWTQVGQDIDGETADDQSGISVSLSSDGSRVAIGASWNDGTASNAGHVRVYDLSGNTWTKVGQDIDGEAANDQSGTSVSLSSDGSRVAIGALNNDGTASNAGHVRVYDLIGTTWTQVGQDINGEAANDYSGRVSLSSNGSRVAIGAIWNDGTASNSDAGHVRVYDLIGTTWTQVGQDIDAEAANDRCGTSVSLSSDGSRVAIGAPYNHGSASSASSAGHVRVYDLIGTTWTQVGQDIDGETADDQSGTSVSLSSDGSRVAIGASWNDGTASNAGHVRVYDLIGTTWTKVGQDIDGEAANDFSGSVVRLSSNGTRVAIGAIYNDGTASNAGHIRVYEFN